MPNSPTLPVNTDEPPLFLLIPANTDLPARVAQLNDGTDQIQRAVGDDCEAAYFDADAIHWVDGNGRTDGLPLNERATNYVLHHSGAAQSGRMDQPPAGYGLYGDVAVTGLIMHGTVATVPSRLIDQHDAWFELAPGTSASAGRSTDDGDITR